MIIHQFIENIFLKGKLSVGLVWGKIKAEALGNGF
jgi:hypothetical protein